MTTFLAHYWWAGLFTVITVVWAWRAWRGAQVPPLEPLERPRRPESSTAPFRREDFAARAEAARREMGKGFFAAMAIFLFGFPALFAASWLAPETVGPIFQPLMYVILGGSIAGMFALAARADRIARRSGLVCPACGRGLVGQGRSDSLIHERVLETGKCPKCGAQLLDPAEVAPVDRRMTGADHARALVIIATLLTALGATSYFGNRAINARRVMACNRRYAAAQSAADSVVVDARTLNKKGTLTCGDLRRSGRLDGPEP